MYRYSQQMRGGVAGGQLRQQIGRVLILLLAAAAVVLAILGSLAMGFENHEQSYYQEHMRSEAAAAYSQVNSLSRTGGSTTTNILGKLRQHVYAMETLQSIHVALRGEKARLVEDSVFQSIYSAIDTFDTKLQTGQQTKEPQTQLITLITDLKTRADTLR